MCDMGEALCSHADDVCCSHACLVSPPTPSQQHSHACNSQQQACSQPPPHPSLCLFSSSLLSLSISSLPPLKGKRKQTTEHAVYDINETMAHGQNRNIRQTSLSSQLGSGEGRPLFHLSHLSDPLSLSKTERAVGLPLTEHLSSLSLIKQTGTGTGWVVSDRIWDSGTGT